LARHLSTSQNRFDTLLFNDLSIVVEGVIAARLEALGLVTMPLPNSDSYNCRFFTARTYVYRSPIVRLKPLCPFKRTRLAPIAIQNQTDVEETLKSAHGKVDSRSNMRAKNPSESILPSTLQFLRFPVTCHQSTTVIPMVSGDMSSIVTLQRR